ncbi:MAG: DUF4838 domain-containing protein [Verrucomicrobia bacterium]|nr:DUF4838 domain-containing protein [Verrucomicrobiota bacterium]
MKPILALVLLAGSGCALRGEEFVLARDSCLKITVRGEVGNARECLERLLAKYLLLRLGKQELGGPGDVIEFVLEAKAEDWFRAPKAEMKDVADADAFEVKITAQPAKQVRITGTTALATGFGLMHFLEKHLGIFWAFPGELGLCLPEKREITLREGRERVAPEFASRLATGLVFPDPSSAIPSSGIVHQERMFFGAFDFFKNLRLHGLASPSHNMINVFPVELKKTLPEIFPVKDGNRWFPPDDPKANYHQAWHPCYTNPKTVEIAIEKAKGFFQKNGYCFSLGINDGKRVQCECEACKKAGWPQSYYQFVTKVSEAVKEFYPPQLVGVLAYGDVRFPPKDLRLPPNVLVINATGKLEDWRQHAQLLGTYEYFYGQGMWVPNIPLAAMRSNAQFYRKNRIRFYRGEWHPLWAYDAPKIHIRARQLWQPDLDVDAELRRWCNAAFGPAGPAMVKFYQLWARKRDGDVVADGFTPVAPMGWPNDLWRNPARQFSECAQEEMNRLRQCLEKARTKVGNDGKAGLSAVLDTAQAGLPAPSRQAGKRLEMVETFFNDTAMLFDMYTLANRLFDAGPPVEDVTAIQQAMELREKRLAGLRKMKEHPEWFLGTGTSLDEDLQPSWEERGMMVLPRQLGNAVKTCVMRLAEKGIAAKKIPASLQKYLNIQNPRNVTLHTRPTHPWYGEWGYVPLETTKETEGISFRTVGKTDSRVVDHETLAGRRKVYWLAGFALEKIGATPSVYQLDLNVKGKNGRLVVSLNKGMNNTGIGEAGLVAKFDGKGGTFNKTVAIEPLAFDPKTLKDLKEPPEPGTQWLLNVYLTWEPFDDDSPLEGTCAATRYDLDE